MVDTMNANRPVLLLLAVAFVFYSSGALAELGYADPATQIGILDQVAAQFFERAKSWHGMILDFALWLFWTLGTISLAWTFGMMALRKADIGEFFAEFIRFAIFFGFFFWLLLNGPMFAEDIILSMQQIGERITGSDSTSPSGIVGIGFDIWWQAISKLSALSPIDSFIGVILSAIILTVLAVIAINMLLLYVSGWMLAYVGIFFLGFGGSRWTSDMAINYYKTVLGIATQIMVMILIVGIGYDLLVTYYDLMDKDALNFRELGVMLVFCVALLLLTNKVPSLISGIITGASVGGSGIGQFGAGALAGAAMGAAGMATAGAAMAGSMASAGLANAAGGAQALMAAFSSAAGNVSAGTDVVSNLLGSGGGGSGGSGGWRK
jgi:type IV secretion system protein TrbL